MTVPAQSIFRYIHVKCCVVCSIVPIIDGTGREAPCTSERIAAMRENRTRTITTVTDARITVTNKPATDDLCACDEVSITLPNGRNVTVRVLSDDTFRDADSALGTFGHVYVHAGREDASGEAQHAIIGDVQF